MLKAEIQKTKAKTGLSLYWILKHIGVGRATYYRWLNYKGKQGKGFVHPLSPLSWEKEAVIAYAMSHPLIGYKKLTYQMLDEGIAAISPSQVYRILSREGLLDKWGRTSGSASSEYKDKPKVPNEHWHTDIMYIKVLGMWCFLITVIDGYSRYVVGHKVMLDMTAQSVSLFMQEVIDQRGVNTVKLINDNGSQLISKDMKMVLSSAGICQIRIRRNHPQSNGKAERLNGLIRQECLRPNSPVTFLEVQRMIVKYIDEYNNKRLHSSIDYMRPVDYYMGNEDKIRKQRSDKLTYARQKRIGENREYNQTLKTSQTTSYSKEAFCLI